MFEAISSCLWAASRFISLSVMAKNGRPGVLTNGGTG